MNNKILKIGILASTNGTILPEVVSTPIPHVDFSVFITNKRNCGAREKAKKIGIPDYFIDGRDLSRGGWEKKAIEILDEYEVDLVILIGFMRILSPIFVRRFEGKILNVHPSLLPKFAGGMDTDVHSAVIEAGEKETGPTIHMVSEEVDAGEIFLQEAIPVLMEDTPETLKEKVQQKEAELYPKAIEKFYKERFLY
jgi:phosphoribosylglycinamide formyltransferase-1